MATIELDIPAGVVNHGTDSEAAGRWRDVNYVRWEKGSLRPIGGWQNREDRTDTNNTVNVTLGSNVTARSALAWKSNAGTAFIVAGNYNNLYSITESGTVTSILAAPISGASDGPSVNTGYGRYYYGKGLYGVERPSSGILSEGSVWSLDSWGDYLVAVNSHDGILREWTNTGTATAITGDASLPTNNDALVVTEERFLFALGAGNNPAKVQWCDREDTAVWDPAATNEAGDIELDTAGEIRLGLQVRGRTLILTTVDAHAATYSGPPAVYSFEKVGSDCGAVSRHCAVAHGAGAYWMGLNGFFMYDGQTVRDVPCDVQDYVFKNINPNNQSFVHAVKNQKYNEIWWFYPSTSSTDIDSYVYFDYKENHWGIGKLDRTAAIDAGVYRTPIWFSKTGLVYNHEVGYAHDYSLDGVSYNTYAETGPIEAGTGENIINLTRFIPDHKTTGQNLNVVLKTRNYPNSPETSHGPFITSNPTNIRVNGRQLRLRIDAAVIAVNWTAVGVEALKVDGGETTPNSDVVINGRPLLDATGDGSVSSSDALLFTRHGAGTEYSEYINDVVEPYLLANYAALKDTVLVTLGVSYPLYTVTPSINDWTVGDFKLETKLGGSR